jgi:hypothetical protein
MGRAELTSPPTPPVPEAALGWRTDGGESGEKTGEATGAQQQQQRGVEGEREGWCACGCRCKVTPGKFHAAAKHGRHPSRSTWT